MIKNFKQPVNVKHAYLEILFQIGPTFITTLRTFGNDSQSAFY